MEIEKTMRQQIASVAQLTFAEWRSAFTFLLRLFLLQVHPNFLYNESICFNFIVVRGLFYYLIH